MFERLKKALGGRAAEKSSQAVDAAVSEWAGTRGFSIAGGSGGGFRLSGKVRGMPWKLERAPASRDYMVGEELRARAELGVSEDAAVIIMNRPLKDMLEKQTYEQFTDSLQTTADLGIPEEMRWLSMYPETGWDSLPPEFWARYAVLAENREHALAWIDPDLAELLLHWPEPAPGRAVPFLLMLLRGKVYLRMQYTPADIATLQHAAIAFTSACESAVSGLSGKPVL